MPQLIWCIDDYLKKKKKDCYFVVFGQKFPVEPDSDFNTSDNPAGRQELLDWFKSNSPHIIIEPVWPHSSQSFNLVYESAYDGSVTI